MNVVVTPTPTPSATAVAASTATTATTTASAAGAPVTNDVSPGVAGFAAFFVLAVALYLLMRNMTGRMRRMSYRQMDAGRTGGEAQANEQDAQVDLDGPAGSSG